MQREEDSDADSDSHPPYEMSNLSDHKQIQVLQEPVRRDESFQFIRPTYTPRSGRSPRSGISSPATPRRANANQKQTLNSSSTVEPRSTKISQAPPSFQLISSSSSSQGSSEPENTKRQIENSSSENVEPG